MTGELDDPGAGGAPAHVCGHARREIVVQRAVDPAVEPASAAVVLEEAHVASGTRRRRRRIPGMRR
jgi:hypothetical protein